MAIDTRNKVMQGIEGHHGSDFKDLDPKLPTPSTYAEYVISVNGMSGTPATEAELEAGIVKFDADAATAVTLAATEKADILTLLGITEDDLKKLNRVLNAL